MDLPERLMNLEPGERIVVAVQQRRIDFSNVEVPEVEVRSARLVRQCATSMDLVRLLETWPERRIAGLRWWALDRREACTSCGRGFDTGRPHWALSISIEAIGTGGALIACWYPERYCMACRPPEAGRH